MSCECEQYVCLKTFASKCGEGVQLPLVADYTGNIKGEIYFNDVVSVFTVGVVENAKIVIPSSLLNESYVHKLILYKDGELWGCYHVKTIFDINAGTFDLIEPTLGYLQSSQVTGNGLSSQTFASLLGFELVTISMGGQEYTNEFWTQAGSTVTWDSEGMTFVGEVVLTFK